MEGHADLGDWEILLGPELGEDLKPLLEASEDGPQDGALKSDYFSPDPRKRRDDEVAAAEGDIREEVLAEGLGAEKVDSGVLSWIDPESISRFVDRPKAEHVLPGIELARGGMGRFWSDESSDGRRSRTGSEMGELGDTGELEIGEITDGHKETEADAGLQGMEVGLEKLVEEEPRERVKIDECCNSSVEMSEERIDPQNDLTEGNKEGEMTVKVWWKLPFELLKLCAFRVKPVWSISIAAAILGVLVLRKRLHMMKYKTIGIPLKLSMDQQINAFHLKVRAARLNEAFSIVRRVPLGRSSLPSGGLTSWSVMGLLQ